LFVGALLPPYTSSLATSTEEADVPEQQFLFVEEGFLMKASSIGSQGSRLAFSEGLSHEVHSGETIESIAKRYNVSAETVRWANGLDAKATVKEGDTLIILPVDGVLHAVRRGQTLNAIAQLYGVPAESIARQNKIKGGFIVAGDLLIIPGGKPITDSAIASSMDQALRFADNLPTRTIHLPGGQSVSVPSGGVGHAPAASAIITQTLLQSPCGSECFLTQGYGPGHYALDMQVRGGGPIYAAEAGTVIRAETGYNGGYGNVIEIDHGNGLVTLYAHNKELYVKEGDSVTRGQTIAFMGNTGRVHGPTGIHTHFEVRVNGVKKNPKLYLE
jgi:murein DD-endopeptidase MepM/ murein hydrolase activator NlpD